MKTITKTGLMSALALPLIGATSLMATRSGAGAKAVPPRLEGPCDIYAAAGDPCVAAQSKTRALGQHREVSSE
jgi:hypothetical protein